MKNLAQFTSKTWMSAIATLAGLALAAGCASDKEKSESAVYAPYPSGPAPVVYAGQTTTGSSYATGRGETMAARDNTVVPLYQESVKVGKREVDAGTVRIKKIVKTETINQPIELRHEEVTIERQPASGEATTASPAGGQQFEEKEMVIQLKREEPVIEKQTSSAGQVVLRTRSESEQTNIQSQIRREDVDVAKSSDAQNVTIGQGAQSSSAIEGGGAAESPSGKTSGAVASTSGGTITDPSMLTGSTDASAMTGRTVQFSGLTVRNVISSRLITLSSSDGQLFYALSDNPAGNFKAGDTVNLTGIIRQPSSAAADPALSREAMQLLNSRPFYIETQKIEQTGQ